MKLHPHLRGKMQGPQHGPSARGGELSLCSQQDGYILIVMLLFLTLLAISLTAVAPAMTQRIRREREIELIHRGKQYARAIRLYYRKFGRYPMRLEDLENTNNIRFLRKRYKDPLTASGEWRLIHFGEAQLNLPKAGPLLPGASNPGATVAPGVASPTGAASPFANTFSSSPQPGAAQTSTTTGQASTTQGASADSSQSGQSGGQSGQPGTPASQLSSPLGGGVKFGGGPIVGVASTSKKESIKELNSKNHYNEWEFVYDPTLDLTMAQPVAGAAGQQNPLAPGVQAPMTQPLIGAPNTPGMQPMQPTTPTR